MSSEPQPSERELALRITVVQPPEGVAFSLRTKDKPSVGAVLSEGGDVTFDLTMRAKRVDGVDAPRFLGPYAFGTPEERFFYIRIGTAAGQLSSPWTRAAKIHLSTITWELIDQVKEGGRLEAKVAGRAKDGGPLCASVPLLGGGWKVGS